MKRNLDKYIRIFFIAFLILIFAFICDGSAEDKWMITFDYGLSSVSDISFDGKYHSFQGAYSLKKDNSILFDFGALWIDNSSFRYAAFFFGLKYCFFPERIISPFFKVIFLMHFFPIIAMGADITLDSKAIIPVGLQFGVLRRGISEFREVYIISAGFGFRF